MTTKDENVDAAKDSILEAFTESKEVQQGESKPAKKPRLKKDKAEVVQEETEIWHTGAEGIRYSDDEWKSPVMHGGPTRQEVEEWKERYGEVFFTPFSSGVYVWRKLKRPEYREIIRDTTLNALDREEMFTEKCVIYPRNFSLETIMKSDAGVPSLLSEMIMDKSGFVAQAAPIKL